MRSGHLCMGFGSTEKDKKGVSPNVKVALRGTTDLSKEENEIGPSEMINLLCRTAVELQRVSSSIPVTRTTSVWAVTGEFRRWYRVLCALAQASEGAKPPHANSDSPQTLCMVSPIVTGTSLAKWWQAEPTWHLIDATCVGRGFLVVCRRTLNRGICHLGESGETAATPHPGRPTLDRSEATAPQISKSQQRIQNLGQQQWELTVSESRHG